jgi:hypothetical protein
MPNPDPHQETDVYTKITVSLLFLAGLLILVFSVLAQLES